MKYRLLIIFTIAIFALGTIIGVGCSTSVGSGGTSGGTTDGSSLSTLPGEYKISIPDSLQSTTKSRGTGDPTVDANSLGYKMVQDLTKTMDERASTIAMLMVIVDGLISNESPDTSSSVSWNAKNDVTVDQNMIDNVTKLNGTAPTDVQAGDVIQLDYVYLNTSNVDALSGISSDGVDKPQDAIDGVYDKIVVIKRAAPSMSPPQPGDTRKAGEGWMLQYIMWTNDKQKIKVIADVNTDGPSSEIHEYSYDASQNKSTMLYSWEAPPLEWDSAKGGWTIVDNTTDVDIDVYGMSIEKDTASTANGIMFTFFQKKKRVEGSGNDPGEYKIFDFFVEGYADDNGGYIESNFINKKYKDKNGNDVVGFADMQSQKHREKFDGTGKLIAAMVFDEVTGKWVQDYGTSTDWNNNGKDTNFDNKKDNFDDKKEDPNKFNQYFNDDEAVAMVEIPKPVNLGGSLDWHNKFKKVFAIADSSFSGDITGDAAWKQIYGYLTFFHDEMYLDHSNDVNGIILPFFLHGLSGLSADKSNLGTLYGTFKLLDVSTDNPEKVDNTFTVTFNSGHYK